MVNPNDWKNVREDVGKAAAIAIVTGLIGIGIDYVKEALRKRRERDAKAD
jgi:hypothetical protein